MIGSAEFIFFYDVAQVAAASGYFLVLKMLKPAV